MEKLMIVRSVSALLRQYAFRGDTLGMKEKTHADGRAGWRRLIEGNRRFVAGKARFPTVCKETLAALAKGNKPHATI